MLKRVFKRQTNRQQMYLEEEIYHRVKNSKKLSQNKSLAFDRWSKNLSFQKSTPLDALEALLNEESTSCETTFWEVPWDTMFPLFANLNKSLRGIGESMLAMNQLLKCLLWTQQRYWWWSCLQDLFYGCFECFRRRWRGLTRTSKPFVSTQPMAPQTRNVLE